MTNFSQYNDDFKDLIVRTSYEVPFDELSKIHGVPIYLIRYWRYGNLLIGDDLKTATKVAYKLKHPTNHFKWVTKYHVPLDITSVTAQNIFVTDYSGSRITDQANLSIEPNPNAFSVTPTVPYKYDVFYYLHLTDGLRFTSRKRPKPMIIRFMVIEEHQGKGIRFIKEVVDGYSLLREVDTGKEMEFLPESKDGIIKNVPQRSKLGNLAALFAATVNKGYNFNLINHAYDWKITLRWEGSCETDLDLHAYFSDGTRMYFANKMYAKDAANVAWLDYDYRTHPDFSDRIKKPEIFTLLGKPADAVKIAVNNFNGGSLRKKIEVEIFRTKGRKNALHKKFTIPPKELSGIVGTNYAVCIIDLNTAEVEDLTGDL
ncbi:MAG: hypothetical protein FWG65_01115 [Turicibacter sp.]|nr:hypothetical protein [Turicibacter sp.]